MEQLKQLFNNQSSTSMVGKFNDAESFKTFFVENDGLHNLEHDLIYTALPLYACKAGCKVCFLNGLWLPDETVSRDAVTYVTDEYEAFTEDLFEYFYTVACIDDLRYIKKSHPALMHYYHHRAGNMEFHTSDNGIFTQFDILMNEVRFKEIGQLSFSDQFLESKGGVIVDDVIEKMCLLNDRSPIARLNFVITQPHPENNAAVCKLAEWASKIDHSLSVYFHNDIRADAEGIDYFESLRGYGYKEPTMYHIEHVGELPVKCDIVSETVHMRYNKFYPDLYTSMATDYEPYHVAPDMFDPEKFMLDLLKEKVKIYTRNNAVMSVDTKLHQYFDYIEKHLVINDNFSFIPAMLLDPRSVFYQKLQTKGWKNTYAGLIKEGTENPVPIIEWK